MAMERTSRPRSRHTGAGVINVAHLEDSVQPERSERDQPDHRAVRPDSGGAARMRARAPRRNEDGDVGAGAHAGGLLTRAGA